EKLSGLEMRQVVLQALFWCLGNGLEQGQGHFHANDSSGLEQALLFRWQAVDARRQDGLHGGRHLQALEGVLKTIGAALSDQDPGLCQHPYAFLQEEGVALGTCDQEWLERY